MMGQLGVPELVVIGVICLFTSLPTILGAIVVAWLLFFRSPAGVPLLPPAEKPLDVLKSRYARGEITKEQFDAMKRDLE